MKMRDVAGSDLGKFFDAEIDIPTQEEVESGRLPEFWLCIDGDDVYDCDRQKIKDMPDYNLLNILYAHGIASENAGGLLTVDVLQLFLEAAVNAEYAEIVSGWLEYMAKEVRSKFDKKL